MQARLPAMVIPRRLPVIVMPRRFPVIPFLVIVGAVFVAVFAGVLAPHDPYTASLANRLKPPFWLQGGSLSYPLGTDLVGRDLLSRMMYGARISLLVAFLAIVVGGFIGATLGLVAGFLGGKVDSVIMRAVDITLGLPMILVALLLVATMTPGVINVVIAVSVVSWARYARVIRGQVLSLRERDFVAAAKTDGCSKFRIIAYHLFPNVLNSLLVVVTLYVGHVIIVEASLSFLGAGVPPPNPTWGGMVAEGRDNITSAWWLSTFPGLAIALVVLSFNIFGDWLRDTWDPKLRQV